MKKLKIGEVASIFRGVSYKKEQASKKKQKSYVLLLRANNINAGQFILDDYVFVPNSLVSEEQMIKTGDIVITMSSGSKAHVGKVALARNDMNCTYGAFCSKISPHNINSSYLFFALMEPSFRKHIETQCKGTNINNIKRSYIEDFEIPIPPLSEQERIVAKIEELFSQLDAGVETLKKIKYQLGVFRQAVLKEVFTVVDSAKTVEIAEIAESIRIGPFGTLLHKDDYIRNGIPVINPQHIKDGQICPSPTVTVSSKKAKELSSYVLKRNDIVLGRRGEMGRAAAVTDVENGWLCGTGCILIRLKPDYDAIFYAQILSSPDVVHYLEEHATGTTMKNLNDAIVRHIPVPYITYELENELNQSITYRLSVCDNIEQTVDASLQQADALRQSILKDAFEGRL